MALCACGCGGETRVASRTHTARGWVKGQPIRFIRFHGPAPRGSRNGNWNGGRTRSPHGYVMLMTPGHPGADGRGYVKEHILDVELAMQKEMPAGATVHHINGVKDDNRNDNYVVCDQSYHIQLHRRAKALAECGNPSWWRCWICTEYDDPANMRKAGPSKMLHDVCSARWQAEYKQRRSGVGAA